MNPAIFLVRHFEIEILKSWEIGGTNCSRIGNSTDANFSSPPFSHETAGDIYKDKDK